LLSFVILSCTRPWAFGDLSLKRLEIYSKCLFGMKSCFLEVILVMGINLIEALVSKTKSFGTCTSTQKS
jgi:hypothetical protein